MAVQSVKVTINSQEYTLTYDSISQTYKATVSAPAKSSYNNNAGHYYPVSIVATDDAGNSKTVNDTDPTLGASCKLQVKETVAPTISAIYPTSSSVVGTNAPVIKWTVKDNDSGVDPATISIKIDTGETITEGITTSPITDGYECSYTPASISDGAHTVYFNVSDFDGNAATQATIAFTIDTAPPVLTVTAPLDGLKTNQSTVTVTGTTTDPTSGAVSLTVNGTPVDIGSNGAFVYEFTLVDGENTITIVSTDAAGKASTIVRHVTLDTTPPVISAINITPNPVDTGETYIISVTVTDA